LLELLNRLSEPHIDPGVRMGLVRQVRRILDHETPERAENSADTNDQLREPP
jgi:hypothetical protein